MHAPAQIFYTEPQSNVTSLYNMILSNTTMSYYAQVYTATPGLSPDGRPSVVLDYRCQFYPVMLLLLLSC